MLKLFQVKWLCSTALLTDKWKFLTLRQEYVTAAEHDPLRAANGLEGVPLRDLAESYRTLSSHWQTLQDLTCRNLPYL